MGRLLFRLGLEQLLFGQSLELGGVLVLHLSSVSSPVTMARLTPCPEGLNATW